MPEWLAWLIAFGVMLVWLFCGVRVREALHRRCCMLRDDGSPFCIKGWGGNYDLHFKGVLWGFFFGPIMLAFVYVYELADGTTRRRFRRWRTSRKTRSH